MELSPDTMQDENSILRNIISTADGVTRNRLYYVKVWADQNNVPNLNSVTVRLIKQAIEQRTGRLVVANLPLSIGGMISTLQQYNFDENNIIEAIRDVLYYFYVRLPGYNTEKAVIERDDIRIVVEHTNNDGWYSGGYDARIMHDRRMVRFTVFMLSNEGWVAIPDASWSTRLVEGNMPAKKRMAELVYKTVQGAIESSEDVDEAVATIVNNENEGFQY